MYFEKLSDIGVGERLLEDCWPSALPDAQRAPTEAELRWFGTWIERDHVHLHAVASAREELHGLALSIERQIPIYAGDGAVLPAPHRLYIALETAKVLLARPRSSLAVVRSIVAYSGTGRLMKNQPEAGLALVRGPNNVLARLKLIDAMVRAIAPVVRQIGKTTHKRQHRELAQTFEGVEHQIAVWLKRLRSGKAIHHPERFFAFVDAFAAQIGPLFDQLPDALDAEPSVRAELRATVAASAEGIARFAGEVAAAGEQLMLANQASIHFSWASQIKSACTSGENVLVHELAHVLDFESGALDGGAQLADDPENEEGNAVGLWRAFYEQATNGELEHIHPYGRESRCEFFAVCSAHFFSAPGSIAEHSPALFELLRRTYGYVPGERTPISGFAALKVLAVSKLRVF
ncbi:hypothetical protein BH11MYX1_BH11MYX1_43750 [soil metagenome]